MILTISIICLHLSLICWFLSGISHDKDFQIEITRKDIMMLFTGGIINVFVLLLYKDNISAFILLGFGLAYLLTAAYTDKKTMMVLVAPGYMFMILSIILESISLQKFSFFVLIVYILPIFLGIINAFGKGDAPMCTIIGGVMYFITQSITDAIFVECIMILIAEIFFIIKAIISKNMKNVFSLKQKSPFGPSILLATYLLLIIIKFI